MNLFNFEINPDLDKTLEPVKTNVVKPLSYAALGLLNYGIGGLVEKGILDSNKIKYLEECANKEYNKISPENLTNDQILVAAQIFNDSIYHLSSEEMIELFAKLIAACYDDRKNVKPYYSSILNEMSPDEAKLFKYFFNFNFLFEFQLSCNSPTIKSDSIYKTYWEKKYFQSLSDEDFQVYVNYDNEDEDIRYSNGIKTKTVPVKDIYKIDKNYLLVDIEESFQFLLKNSLIEISPQHKNHQFIPSMIEYIKETDPIIEQIETGNAIFQVKIDFDYNVYKLSKTGKALKDILIDNIIVDDQN